MCVIFLRVLILGGVFDLLRFVVFLNFGCSCSIRLKTETLRPEIQTWKHKCRELGIPKARPADISPSSLHLLFFKPSLNMTLRPPLDPKCGFSLILYSIPKGLTRRGVGARVGSRWGGRGKVVGNRIGWGGCGDFFQ